MQYTYIEIIAYFIFFLGTQYLQKSKFILTPDVRVSNSISRYRKTIVCSMLSYAKEVFALII